MSKKQISNINLRVLNTTFGYLAKAPSKKVGLSDIPNLVAVDRFSEDKTEHNLKLVAFKRIDTDIIPQIMAYHSEGLPPEECTQQVLDRSDVSAVNELAYYIFQVI